jgi:outer membrane protein TolC
MLLISPAIPVAAQPASHEAPARQTLSPADAVARAAAHNPALRAALIEVRAAEARREGVWDARVPTFSASATGSRAESIASTAVGSVLNDSSRLGLGLGLGYTTDFGMALGLTVDSSLVSRSTNRDVSTTTSFDLAPTWVTEVALLVRQPLLRGFGSSMRGAELDSAQLSVTAAELRAAHDASQLAADVVDAYWQLWYADQALEVQRQAKVLVEQQHAEAQMRAELGTLAPSDTLRFASELAAIEETLSAAETERNLRAVALGQRIGLSPRQAAAIDVDDLPPAAPASSAGVDDIAAIVVGRSPELKALEADLEAARRNLVVTSDATLPRLDVIASVGGSTLFGGEMADPWALPEDRPAVSAMVGLELELPLGRDRADAQHTEAVLRLDASEARYEARVDAVEAEAATLVAHLDAAARRVELTERTVVIARQLSEAERNRLELGQTTPLAVLEAQQSERQAELRLLRAQVERATAHADFEHLTGALVARYAL